MKKIILVFSFITLFTLSQHNIYACSCGIGSRLEIESLSEAYFTQAINPFETIFEGRVVNKKRMKSGDWKVTFEVEKYWKRVKNKRVIIYTALNTASCGVPYKLGEEYLVPEIFITDRLYVGLCAHLFFNEYKDVILKKLGTPLSIPSKNIEKKPL